MGSPRRIGVLLLKIKTHVSGEWKVLSPPACFCLVFFFLLAGEVCMMSCLQADPSYPPSIDPPLCF